jgi:hypothetical protein
VCLFLVLLTIAPRVALAWLWLFTTYVDRAFETWIVPLVGLVFLPVTTLMYVLAWGPGGLTPGDWLWVLLGLVIDLSATGGGSTLTRRRRATA